MVTTLQTIIALEHGLLTMDMRGLLLLLPIGLAVSFRRWRLVQMLNFSI